MIMSIADFNKDNPFIVIIRKMENELYKEVMTLTKYMYVYTVITFILSCTITIITKDLSLVLFSIFSILYNIYVWRNVVSKSEFANINRIIYGEEFSAILVNNEKLFDVIQSMNIAKGELHLFNDKMNYDILIWISLVIYSVVTKLL